MTDDPTQFSPEMVAEVFDEYAFPPGGPFSTGSIEAMEWLAVCENSFGFSFEVVSEPGQDPHLYGQVPSSQDAFHSEVRSACREYPVEQGVLFPLAYTDEFGRRVYSAFLRVYDCMVVNGFPVDEPPSEETFVATWVSGTRTWHPYDATPFGGSLSVSPDAEGMEGRAIRQLEIQETCPADWGTILADESDTDS